MKYQVKGTIISTHTCDCEYCDVTTEKFEYDDMVYADSPEEAIGLALPSWALSWYNKPTVVEVDLPFNVQTGGQFVLVGDEFISDGFIALKRPLIDIDISNWNTRTAQLDDSLKSKQPYVLLECMGINDDTAVYRGGEEDVVIGRTYHEAAKKLNLTLYSCSDPVRNWDVVVLMNQGDLAGYLMPMRKER